ncbi:hypothetical protein NDK47_01140 [Brevibacillus ruminantium]|uniref:DUF4252 domain-containing protein n=1 Tax=Brevibacillus ruminantium TaxID=2950604 RepID=A0ABY4WFY6_9BACL|nr:hypothetical protein [Brevibacillus ruminantium]USG65992.1 hypothetical protein NDK47_01140 [Brevibacillus ruminantium]
MRKGQILIFSLLIIYSLSQLIYFPGLKVSSFDELGLFDKHKITGLAITKIGENDRVQLTDQKEIQKILDDLSKLELRKIKSEMDAMDMDPTQIDAEKNSQKYFIDIKENNRDVGTAYLSGTKYIKFYMDSTTEILIYKIVNTPELDIHHVFDSAKNN